MIKKTPVILAIFIMLVVFISPGRSYALGNPEAMIRVLIMDNKENVWVSLKGKYEIYNNKTGILLSSGPYLSMRVFPDANGVRIGNRTLQSDDVNIKISGSGNAYIDGRRFRGEINIVRKNNKKLMIINRIGLEDYLYGVLYQEVSHRWPMEALKAQAVASRTFALYQIMQNSNQPYDLGSDIYSQVYGGRTSERWTTNTAVNRTKAQVLVYEGKLFPAYFHATCAGHTEKASNLWKVDLPPLTGVPCNYCRISPHYRWNKDVPIWSAGEKLKNGGYKIGRISSVDIISKNESGRVDKMEIKDLSGASVQMSGKDFRQIIGPNELKSTKFNVQARWGMLIMNGLGWGHGVGMCQWGAYGMSNTGKNYEEILKYYYPGAEIVSMDSLPQS